MTINSVTPRNATKLIELALASSLVPFLSGSPGLGKSALVRSIAKEHKLELIDYRASMGTPEDMMGLPFRDGDRSKFLPFADTFPIEGITEIPKGKNGFILFLDEINAAPRSMLAALYKLILDRKVGMQNLHPDTYIICAGNRTMDRAIVNNMGTAMQSRLSHLELISNTKEWLEDVAIPMQFDSRVVAFINAYPDRLNTFDPQNEDISFACPRTWEFTNNICKQLEPDKGIPDEVIPLIAGTLGEGVAVEFVQFTQVFKDIPSLDQVLKDPEGCFIPDTPTMQWATICSLAQKHSIEEFAKVSKYTDRYRLSFKLIYHKTILSRLPELRNEPEWVKNAVQIHKYLHG